MSVDSRTSWWQHWGSPEGKTSRTLALVSVVLVTVVYTSVLYSVIDIVGVIDAWVYVFEIVIVVGITVWVSRYLSLRSAMLVGSGLVLLGLAGYLLVVPAGLVSLPAIVNDAVALLTGLSVLQIIRAEVWVLGFTPGPVFASWYCVLRRQYDLGALVAGSTIVLLLLTGDMGHVVGAIGAVGVMGIVGFGRLELAGENAVQRDTILVILVTVMIVTVSVNVVPGGAARPVGGSGAPGTVEGSLFSDRDQVDIAGSVDLSPRVRFTVTSPRSAYWRTGAYDRYTGTGWIRTGRSSGYVGSLDSPDSPTVSTISQSVQIESDLGVMPAAWKPIRMSTGSGQVQVTSLEGLQPRDRFESGDRYSVRSAVPEPSPGALRTAGTEYPAGVQPRFTQLPESTPASVSRFTDRLTADTQTPYDSAVVIRDWLAANKAYSLEVDRPDGDIAAGFLFEMDAGYCTYFATAMVAMLRTQDIPARFVSGYGPGQQVGENTWVVRGLDSHAWVEVYFPGHGWVAFDPTPSGPRDAVRGSFLETARSGPSSDVDTALSEGLTYGANGTAGEESQPADRDGDSTDQSAPTPTRNTSINASEPLEQPGFTPIEEGAVDPGEFESSSGGMGLPSIETIGFGGIVVLGFGVIGNRLGIIGRGRRAIWVRRRPRGSPEDRVIGAFDRIEYVLGRQYRERATDETRREYLASLQSWGVDERVNRIYRAYERAYYGGAVDPAEATACAKDARRYLADHVGWYWAA